MTTLCRTVVFLACVAGAAESDRLHIAGFFQATLVVGATVMFLLVAAGEGRR